MKNFHAMTQRERYQFVQLLLRRKMSYQQIADELGTTRNSVAGMVNRLHRGGPQKRGRKPLAEAPKIEATVAPVKVAKAPPPKATPKARPQPAAKAPSRSIDMLHEIARKGGQLAVRHNTVAPEKVQHDRDAALAPAARKLKLTELTERTCKFPHGDPKSDTFYFCGADAEIDGPYCSYHARMAYIPALSRIRVPKGA